MVIIVIVIVVLVIGWLAYEMIMAPIMPDDYGVRYEESKELTKENNETKK